MYLRIEFKRGRGLDPIRYSTTRSFINFTFDIYFYFQDNVHGPRCDECRAGTFHLDKMNPLGCTKCFCNGVTDVCTAAKLPVYIVSRLLSIMNFSETSS